MRIDIISAIPELLHGFFSASIVKRAINAQHVEIHVHNLRDYSTDKRKSIDDYPFGGGAGMLLTIEPVDNCILHLQKTTTYDEIIYLTPDGELFNQSLANKLSLKGNIILLCGHYKGIDQRIRDHLITLEISIGDYVLSGGEIGAAVLTDAIVRLIPGVLGDETSALTDSFQDNMLAPPVYTRPSEYKNWAVPDVLLSGNFAEIEKWRAQKAEELTKKRRPHLLDP